MARVVMLKKTFTFIMFTMLGILIGVAGTLSIYYLKNQRTEVWTSQTELHDDNGLVIPRGTKFIHQRWMPEGFATLRLYLNIEGSTLDAFTKKQEPKYNLVIPYSVWEEGS